MYELIVANATLLLKERFGVDFSWDNDMPNSVNEDELYYTIAQYDCPEAAEDIVQKLIRADIAW